MPTGMGCSLPSRNQHHTGFEVSTRTAHGCLSPCGSPHACAPLSLLLCCGSAHRYGEKIVKGSSNPRSYYKCSHGGCGAKKIVERNSHGEILASEYRVGAATAIRHGQPRWRGVGVAGSWDGWWMGCWCLLIITSLQHHLQQWL